MQTKFPLTFFIILICISFNSFASTDSLIVKGRILNLTGRLYRQAPSISFSRNNILQPQSEITKRAELQVDGSFRVALPILFPNEEIYLDYSGKAGSTFLGSKGAIEITFDGDSLLKAKKLFAVPHLLKLLEESFNVKSRIVSNFTIRIFPLCLLWMVLI